MTTTTASPTHATTKSGADVELAMRQVLFGNTETDIAKVIGRKFSALMAPNTEEANHLWFGQVTAVMMTPLRGDARLRLVTTLGEFVYRPLEGFWVHDEHTASPNRVTITFIEDGVR